MIKEALNELEKAVTIVPDDPMIIEHLGDVYLKSGKKDKAIAQYERVLKIDPEQKKIKEKLENLKRQK